MTWWMILLIVLAVLWLISLIQFGARVHYGQDGLKVTLILGPARIQVLPGKKDEKPKKKTDKKPKKEKTAKPRVTAEEAAEEKPGTLSRVMKLLPVVAEAAGALFRKIRIDDLQLSVIWGGANDAAAAAIGYGRAQAAIGMIWPLLDHNFKVKKAAFHVDVDYNGEAPVVAADAAITLTFGQILSLGIHYGIKALINWTRSGKASAK